MAQARSSRDLDALAKVCNELVGKSAGLSRNYRGIPTRADIRRAIEHAELAIAFLDRQIGDPLPTLSGGLRRVVSGLTNRLMKPQEEDAVEEREPAPKLSTTATRHVPMTGNTETIPLPGLLFFLQEHKKTGTLNVVTDAEVFTVEFEGGELVHATSDNSPPGCRLGEILVQQGAIAKAQLSSLLTKYSRAQGRLGEALDRGEIVSREQLRVALEHQIQELFDRLNRSNNAYFHFTEGKSEGNDGRVRMNVTKLLMEAVRREDEE